MVRHCVEADGREARTIARETLDAYQDRSDPTFNVISGEQRSLSNFRFQLHNATLAFLSEGGNAWLAKLKHGTLDPNGAHVCSTDKIDLAFVPQCALDHSQ